jgi:hypothetical protein
MTSTIGERLAASAGWLDGIAEQLQPLVQRVVEASPQVKNAVDGTWLRTPLHPALTDVPVGAYTTSVVLDAADALTGSEAARNGADAALAVGIASSLPAAATGAGDWRTLQGADRRLGLIPRIGQRRRAAGVRHLARAARRRAAGRGACDVGGRVRAQHPGRASRR